MHQLPALVEALAFAVAEVGNGQAAAGPSKMTYVLYSSSSFFRCADTFILFLYSPHYLERLRALPPVEFRRLCMWEERDGLRGQVDGAVHRWRHECEWAIGPGPLIGAKRGVRGGLTMGGIRMYDDVCGLMRW